jgi:hypothetical protein
LGRNRTADTVRGLHLSAHVYDGSPKLTDQFRVYAVTRRGVGARSPNERIRPARRAADILEVIGASACRSQSSSAIRVAAESCIRSAPSTEDVGGLVYLDAAEDPTLKPGL